MRSRMPPDTDAASGMWGRRGQSSVEAALLLPTLLLLLALLMQPACLLYTRAVMEGAAMEVARLQATSDGTVDVRAYALRRLRAVPEVSVFHVGGEGDWQVRAGDAGPEGLVEVEIVGHARPLPLFGGISSALGEADETGIVLRARACVRERPAWLGGGYDDWVGVWG